MSVAVLQDEVVHYEVLGRGRPLIFLHGWVGSWRYWLQAMQAASLSYRAYAIDLWGFGGSSKNPQNYSLATQSSLLDSFIDKMGIDRIALAGHSLGALVALDFAARNPALVDRVCVIGSPLDSSTISPRLKTSSPAELAGWLLDQPQSRDALLVEANKADPRALTTSIGELEEIDLLAFSRSIKVPCLMVYGLNDQLIPLPDPEELSVLPGSSHAIFFDDSGHFPMLDDISKFNRLLADFLALPPGESPRQLQLKEEWKRRVR
jgi:pimeloyl-ACP methyl ester carboxylesterase